MTGTAMIDRIATAAMNMALQQAQLTNQLLVIGQADEAASPQRQRLQVNLGLADVARLIADAGGTPGRLNPLGPVAVTDDGANMILPAEGSEFLGDDIWIERRPGATNDIDDVLSH